jgi:3'-phosphoadenosine 5'-phosphosulfate sulfotransferase (PAPS reductase)/FAD synthetase
MKALAGLDGLRGRRVIVKISGGKDSTAMERALTAAGVPIYARVLADIGWEARETVEYVRDYLPTVMGEITTVRRYVPLAEDLEPLAQAFERRLGFHSPFIRLMLRKAAFSPRSPGAGKWCTAELKIHPFHQWIEPLLETEDLVVAIGVRRDESRARADQPVWQEAQDLSYDLWSPIADWAFEDVVATHTETQTLPNPLYLAGSRRVGCWPCVNANKEEILQIAERDPERMAILSDLEAVIAAMIDAKQEMGERLKLGDRRPKFFERKEGRQGPAADHDATIERLSPWQSVDEVIDWAKGRRGGGAQLNLFDGGGPSQQPCRKWGLCER